MEDGGKEDTTKPKEVKISGKAGWLKKSSGKFFGTYKDRYIHLEHTEIVVYENEDMKNCLERLDLENYEKCHELRGPFKKKNRLILIRAPKCANKVHDVKLQAQNQEEKEAWIKALSDGINRAKNKVFDEVKIEEGCSLEHVTRTRPKANRGRRPPTRIHMKEVANVSSDGILRLDLDVTDSTANGTFYVNTEDSTPKEGIQSGTVTSDSPKNEPTSEEAPPPKKVLKPPMPPSKQNKPASPSEEDTHAETTSDSGVDTGAPPTPSKPSGSQDDLSSDSSSVDKDLKPPKPPSKDKKPTLVDKKEEATETPEGESVVKDKEETAGKPDKESEDKTEETTKAAEDEEEDKATNMDDLPPTNVLKPSVVMWDTPLAETSSEAEQTEAAKETQATPEPLKKSTGPPAPPKKKPAKCPVKSEDKKELNEAKKDEGKEKENESTSSELISESAETVAETQPETNTPSTSPEPPVEREAVLPTRVSGEIVEPCDVSVSKVEQEEEKSVDSGQHSAEESENGDAITTTTMTSSITTTAAAALLCSQTKPDEDSSETDETDPPNVQSKSSSEEPPPPSTSACTPSATEKDSAVTPSVRSKPQILSPRPLLPLKPKARSASMGDLLAETPAPEKQTQEVEKASATPAESNMEDLTSKVTLEIKNTEELLHTVSDKQTAEGESQDELLPEALLATAMEKLRTAEEILSVAKSFKEKKAVDKESKRMSW